MVKKQALPSYHTVVVELPNPEVTHDDVRFVFEKFGEIRQVEFVYDYGTFLLELKELLVLIEKYS